MAPLLSVPIYLIDMCFGDDQIVNIIKSHVGRRKDYIFKHL
jgi:hypothetical protein